MEFIKKTECLSTGSINIDNILGIGGLPYGRIIEIFGQESSGKSTIAFSIIKEAQKVGDLCSYIDVEHCLDVNYLNNIGVNINKMLIFQPDTGEKVFELCKKLIISNFVKVIVIDSVTAIISENDVNKDETIGSHSRLLSSNLKKILHYIRKFNILYILINQVRIKICNFYSKEVSTGGNSIKFYSSIRIELKKIGFLKSKNNIIGQEVKVTIIKNKLSKPFRSTNIYIIFGYGIYKIIEIFNLSIKLNIIIKINNLFLYNKKKYNRKKIFNLLNNKEIYKDIENKIKKTI